MTDTIMPSEERIEEIARFVQEECLSNVPVIVLGSGASVQHGLPTMNTLKNAIINRINSIPLPEEEKLGWEDFKKILDGEPINDVRDSFDFNNHGFLSIKDFSLGRDHIWDLMQTVKLTTDQEKYWTQISTRLYGRDLESALLKFNIQSLKTVEAEIVKTTWLIIAKADVLAFNALTSDPALTSLPKLYKRLLSGDKKRLVVITPNYDRIAEYAADLSGIPFRNGFSFGYFRSWREDEANFRIMSHDLRSESKIIDIFKPHGSVDWFRGNGRICSVPVHALDSNQIAIPSELDPLIVTPGTAKYEETFREPFRRIIRDSDTAINQANSFLCFGYGFADMHLQERLIERVRSSKKPIVIVTKDLTPVARETIMKASSSQRFAAFTEEKSVGTRVYCHDHPDGFVIEGKDYWQMASFIDTFL